MSSTRIILTTASNGLLTMGPECRYHLKRGDTTAGTCQNKGLTSAAFLLEGPLIDYGEARSYLTPQPAGCVYRYIEE
eukprot:4024322-Amphidinium_carterae.1